MDLNETLTTVLNELRAKGHITMTGKQFVQQTFYDYAQQTINLNNNQCGSTMTGTQQDITAELLQSVNRYMGFPKQSPCVDLTVDTLEHVTPSALHQKRKSPSKQALSGLTKVKTVHNLPHRPSAR